MKSFNDINPVFNALDREELMKRKHVSVAHCMMKDYIRLVNMQ